MRFILTFAVLAVSLCQYPLLSADDNLFSELAMESVFEKNASLSSGVASLGDGEKLERITGVSSLALALTAAGFTPKQVDDVVSIQVDHAGWKLPVVLEVQIEQDQILCKMSLVEVADASVIDSGLVLKLLEENDTKSGAYFAYDSKAKLIQLRSTLENRAITAQQLKADLVQMATFAERNSKLWLNLKAKPETKATATSAGNAADLKATKLPPQASTNQLSLAGTWGASLKGADSIAIQIGSDSSFKLATVIAGKSSISQGRVTRTGNRLTLVGDDKITINGTVSQSTADKFQLVIQDDKGNAKLTLDFSRSK